MEVNKNMSVPKSKRGNSELRILTRVDELAVYTIQICSNENNFPKRYRWCLTSKIVEDTVDIVRLVKMANSITINTDEELFKMRTAYQNKAYALTNSLLGMIDIAYRIFDIDSKRISYWTGIIVDVQKLLKNWQKANKQQFNIKLDCN